MVGNSTFLIGTTADNVDRIKEILVKTCSKRKQINTSSNSLGRGLHNNELGDEVTVGGATIFVLNVNSFEKF